MGIVTTSSEAIFPLPAESIYDFVSNPANWPKTYPGSMHVEGLPERFPLEVGDTWRESGPAGEFYSWHLAIAVRPKLWLSNTFGALGQDRDGRGGTEARISVEYRFLQADADTTLFHRAMTVETYTETPLPDEFYRAVNPTHAQRYFDAIARELQC